LSLLEGSQISEGAEPLPSGNQAAWTHLKNHKPLVKNSGPLSTLWSGASCQKNSGGEDKAVSVYRLVFVVILSPSTSAGGRKQSTETYEKGLRIVSSALALQDWKNSSLLNNDILGATLENYSVTNLTEPVEIRFWHNQTLVTLQGSAPTHMSSPNPTPIPMLAQV
uniref:Adhesion G protein-coupled receptor G5 n=1 Tax=Chrysemys picta bellii TaxID=8478 RepID=A0A8C3FUQ6_CHRPI